MPDYYRMGPADSLKVLLASENGLTDAEAASRLGRYGLNELKAEKPPSKLSIFIRQFRSFLVYILIAAAGISLAIGEAVDAAVIGAILVLNALLGFVQEYRAERALEALKKLAAPQATVLRNGAKKRVPSIELVPGDIVMLEEGDKVPADCRLVECFSLKTNEASLTGESAPVEKSVAALRKEAVITDMTNCCFAGTSVVFGHGKAVVMATGMETEFGKIAKEISETGERETPLQRKLASFGRTVGIGVIIITAIVAITGILRGRPPVEMFITGVALAVAAVPEGLPAIVTITLALGLRKMARNNAIVRRLPAVETLGATSVICSDKTGTLTRGEMMVERIYAGGESWEVTGEGYSTTGGFVKHASGGGNAALTREAERLLMCGLVCNRASVREKGVMGDPTEAALVISAAKAGFGEETRLQRVIVGEVPFSSERKRMTVVCKEGKQLTAYMKGAPEVVLDHCSYALVGGKMAKLTPKLRGEILEANSRMAKDALRVLGFAFSEGAAQSFGERDERDFVFIGLQGMIDPPRKEVKDAVGKCVAAGVRVMMITGDNPVTAEAVAREIGIRTSGALTGVDIDKLSDRELTERVKHVSVFARVSPEHKSRIVRSLQDLGFEAAVTGDGVNDAPALKQASIGIAMGITGTDVTKEASDMVLADDNFTTIVLAVEEGRAIFDNIKRFVRYLLTANAGEVAAMFAATLFALPLPFTALQLLWINLATDGIPALALGVQPPEKGIMSRPPRKSDQAILNRRMKVLILATGVIIAAFTLLALFLNISEGIAKAQTMAFTTIVLIELFDAFSSLSDRTILTGRVKPALSLWLACGTALALQLAVIYLGPLAGLFETYPLAVVDWLEVAAFAVGAFLAIEIVKEVIHKIVVEKR
ncbi:calcium-translocating P-type ATPase, SERCA-type [Candidatus Micrarchaeota archaeon]|nr:calcium-translocating P-type ATPase, SERCA-type [Candidatus Micrarchaeota archaeon]